MTTFLQHSNFLLSPLATIFHAVQIVTINSVINGRMTGSNQLISGNVLEKRDFLNSNNKLSKQQQQQNVAKWSAAPERPNVLLVQTHRDKWCHCVWYHCATTVRYPFPTRTSNSWVQNGAGKQTAAETLRKGTGRLTQTWGIMGLASTRSRLKVEPQRQRKEKEQPWKYREILEWI